MKDMNSVIDSAMKWGKRALAVKVGKAALRKGGVIGLGVGAVAGAGYLAYNFFDKRKKKEEARREHLRRIDNIEDNNPEVQGDKKIII